jgi:hypothetical protein
VVQAFHRTNTNAEVVLDKAGRTVLHKRLRDEARLGRGRTNWKAKGEWITLRPVRPEVTLKKECGVWVYQGEPIVVPIPDLIDREREKRLRELIG